MGKSRGQSSKRRKPAPPDKQVASRQEEWEMQSQAFHALLVQQWPALEGLLDDDDLKVLWDAKFRNVTSIEAATEATLLGLPLAPGIVSVLKSAKGPPPLPDGAEILQQSMVPPQALPSAEGFRSFLLTESKTLRVPVSQEAAEFIHGTGDEAASSFVAASKPLEVATTFLSGHTVSGNMEEDKTTSMMSALFQWLPREIFKKLGSSPNRVQSFSFTGNKAEKRKSNPSTALSRKLQRPDMLCFVGGATSLIGEDKGEGDMAMAQAEMKNYCDSGFLPYHYGPVSMIPIYAAAGCEVALGHYTQDGQIHWDMQLSMLNPGDRALAVLAAVQMARWWRCMETLLPPVEQRLQLLEATIRGHVTIIHEGRRVHKYIDNFDDFVAEISSGIQADTQFEIINTIYQKSNQQTDEQHFMAKATTLPSLSRHRRYSVKLQAYGLHANPQTLQHFWALLRSLCLTAETLHSLGYVMRDFRQPNVLTRDNGQEGAYVTIDFEFAGLANAFWTGPGLADWDEQTLEQDGTYSFLSDMHQIGVLMTRLPAWSEHASDVELSQFVAKLLQKEFTAQAALQYMPESYAMHR